MSYTKIIKKIDLYNTQFYRCNFACVEKKPNSRNPEASNARIYFASVLFFARNGRQLNERKRNKRDFYGPDRGIEWVAIWAFVVIESDKCIFHLFMTHTHKHFSEYYIDIFISVEINEGNKNKMNPAEQIKKNKSPTPMN